MISILLQKAKQLLVEFSAKDLIYLFVILCLLILLLRDCGRKSPNVEIKKPALVPAVQKVDKKGTVYTQIKGTIYTQDQMDHLTDSFKKVLKQGKVLQVVQTTTIEVHDTIPVPVYVDSSNHIMSASDSTRFYSQTFTGNWKTMEGRFTFHLVPDTATYVTTVKTHWFKADVLTANVYHTDTLFKPVMGDVYTAKTLKSIIDFDLFAGYDPFTNKPVVAIGAGIHLFSIKRKN